MRINGIGWDSEKWHNEYTKGDYDYRRKLLAKVFQVNTEIIREGYEICGENKKSYRYSLIISSNNEVSAIYTLQERSKLYTKLNDASCRMIPLDKPAIVNVVNEDCLKTAKSWADNGIEVCVLNMANRQHPGGSVITGSMAQEEHLFRCSSYYLAMFPYYYKYSQMYDVKYYRDFYPLDKNYGGLYTPNVTVFRDGVESGYAFLKKPFNVNFIAVAAMRNPQLIDSWVKEVSYWRGTKRIADHLVEPMRNKIRTIFRIAIDNGQRNLVLGALGCGAFHNPPHHVAELFRNVLCEQEFIGAFERITFAVLNDSNSNGDSNYIAFKKELDGFEPPMK